MLIARSKRAKGKQTTDNNRRQTIHKKFTWGNQGKLRKMRGERRKGRGKRPRPQGAIKIRVRRRSRNGKYGKYMGKYVYQGWGGGNEKLQELGNLLATIISH